MIQPSEHWAALAPYITEEWQSHTEIIEARGRRSGMQEAVSYAIRNRLIERRYRGYPMRTEYRKLIGRNSHGQ